MSQQTVLTGPKFAERPAPLLPPEEPLLREALGSTLRDYRGQSGFSLRELASLANVSPGYLSELERGRKEVSSELLASVCHAMGVSVASVILEAASMMALDAAAAELAADMASRAGA
ncbi:MAG TPA: helix-turn-helix domain-containing protein [Candidatus Corynebacterium gallistercoris]|uniref:Helix-turn-helix domain-containing protein n=1 Tax=Candidatus Corynebacterium gallistercoris TaxID=2838530 RepID=A0A9D1UQS2_9CORY|nr:helix-turn-helix domain-containing protein [Candidatus Corynebacterium gallistercoris]